MPEKELTVQSRTAGKIVIESTAIRGSCGMEYPKIMIPVNLILNPIRLEYEKKQPYVILNILGKIINREDNRVVADTIKMFFYEVKYTTMEATVNLEFPITMSRIEAIEAQRKGDLQWCLNLEFSIGIFESIELTVKTGNITKEFVSKFLSVNSSVDFEIPQSHWAKNVLPGLGYGNVYILEIAIPGEETFEGFPSSLEEFSHAQKYFIAGDYDKAVAHCRSALEPLKDKIDELKHQIDSKSEFKWLRDAILETANWLTVMHKNIQAITSKTHHLPSVGHYSRYEAKSIMMISAALISYIGHTVKSST